jgi:hypothetical protein
LLTCRNRKKDIMPLRQFRLWCIVAIASVFGIATTSIRSQGTNPKTFVMTISLPSPSMHVGDKLVFKLVTTNPTDSVIYAGQGSRGGPGIELINEKGEDIGVHAEGGISKQPPQAGGSWTLMWQDKPEPGYLVPGVYKLRVHRRDVGSGTVVYSNFVMLTVVP